MNDYYRNKLPSTKPLSPAEEAELFAAYRRKKTMQLRERIVRQYLYWAAEIACRYCGPRMSREDAISAANLGLMEAIENFDPARGNRFVTHSYFPIRRSVFNALRGTYVVSPASGINVIRHRYNRSAKTPADRERLVAESRKVFDCAGSVLSATTLDAPPSPGEKDRPRPLNGEGLGRDPLEDRSMLEFIRRQISSMPRLERRIFTLRYLGTDTPRFCDIGKKLRRSKDHCRYKHDLMFAQLREMLAAERRLP